MKAVANDELVRNAGGEEYDETGWSAMLAGKHEWGALSGTLELLHVSSKCEEWEEYGLKSRERQTQVQAQLRMHW